MPAQEPTATRTLPSPGRRRLMPACPPFTVEGYDGPATRGYSHCSPLPSVLGADSHLYRSSRSDRRSTAARTCRDVPITRASMPSRWPRRCSGRCHCTNAAGPSPPSCWRRIAKRVRCEPRGRSVTRRRQGGLSGPSSNMRAIVAASDRGASPATLAGRRRRIASTASLSRGKGPRMFNSNQEPMSRGHWIPNRAGVSTGGNASSWGSSWTGGDAAASRSRARAHATNSGGRSKPPTSRPSCRTLDQCDRPGADTLPCDCVIGSDDFVEPKRVDERVRAQCNRRMTAYAFESRFAAPVVGLKRLLEVLLPALHEPVPV